MSYQQFAFRNNEDEDEPFSNTKEHLTSDKLEQKDDTECIENEHKHYPNTKKHMTVEDEVNELYERASSESSDGGEDVSESDDDDENAELLTPAVEKKWWETLAMIKSNNPKKYEVVDSDSDSAAEKGSFEDAANDVDFPTYDDEQNELKKSFLAAAGTEDSEDDDNVDLVKVKKKSAKELEEESKSYITFLKGEEAHGSHAEEVMSGLKEAWDNETLSDGDKFLKDYLLNRRWEGENGFVDSVHPGEEQFHDYKFRFEEPDTEFIKSYPSKIEGSIRQKKETRKKKKTKKVIDQKNAAKEQLRKEKQLRYQVLQSVSDKIKERTKKGPVAADLLDDDYDPTTHDEVMKERFEEKPIDENEFLDDPDSLEKPVFEYDEDIDGPRADEDAEDFEERLEEHPDFEQEEDESEAIEQSGKRKRSRHKKHNKNKLARTKANLSLEGDSSLEGKSLSDYLDAYYDISVRKYLGGEEFKFPYRQVEANDYGLTTNEILLAPEKDLNRWHNVSEISQYMTAEEEEAARKLNQDKKLKKKKKIFPSFYKEEPSNVVEKDPVEVKRAVSKEIQALLERQDQLSQRPKKKKVLGKELSKFKTVKGVPLSRLEAFGVKNQALGKKKKQTKNSRLLKSDSSIRKGTPETWGENSNDL